MKPDIDRRRAFVTGVAAQHGRKLRRYLAARLRNAADVPDLVQEVFLRLMRVERCESIRNPEAYVMTVAGHVVHQHTLRLANAPQSLGAVDVLVDLESTLGSDPAAQVDAERRLKELDRALDTIDDLITRTRVTAMNVTEMAHASKRVEVPGVSPPELVPDSAPRPAGPLARVMPGRLRRFSIAASIVFVSLVAGAFLLHRPLDITYSTTSGQQRTVNLPDGSRIELNARSEMRVAFSRAERHVELLAGEALFRVAKDQARPFVVGINRMHVRAVGTEFDIYRRPSGTTVTVVEGTVAVIPGAESESTTKSDGSRAPEAGSARDSRLETILVSAGQQVTVTRSRPTIPANADVAAVTAWTQGELVFDSVPLAEVVQEFNRYNEKALVVSDEGLRNFHVTGVFSSTNPASLLRFLGAQREVEIVETDSAIRITRKGPAPH